MLAFTALLGACNGGDTKRPGTLMDRTPAKAPPVALEGVTRPAVLTTVQVLRAEQVRPETASASCRANSLGSVPPRGPFVERVGVVSSSVTFAAASGVQGCDDSFGAREGGRRWCGTSFGTRMRGRLQDPRLDIAGCRSATRAPVGFVWIEPSPQARYVAVEQGGYVEVYEPAASLPVRVATTSGIDLGESRATFRISEHDASGNRLRDYELVAVVAG